MARLLLYRGSMQNKSTVSRAVVARVALVAALVTTAACGGTTTAPPSRPDRAHVAASTTVSGGACGNGNLMSANPRTGALFGFAIALDADTLAVAAPQEPVLGMEHGTGAQVWKIGAVHVFRCRDSAWELEAHLSPPTGRIGVGYGMALALDGDTLAVAASAQGAWIDGGRRVAGPGAVYLYRRSGGRWTEEAVVSSARPTEGGLFGRSIGLDADTMVVGASRETSEGASSAGNAYIFRRGVEGWVEEGVLEAPQPAEGDHFGETVAIDGERVAVYAMVDADAMGEDSSERSRSGAVYVFRREGGSWVRELLERPASIQHDDYFGHRMALDGDTLVVGAMGDDAPDPDGVPILSSGAVYVFRWTGSEWAQESLLRAPTPTASAHFGMAVALEGDTAVLSAPDERAVEPMKGAVYVFRRSGATWTQEGPPITRECSRAGWMMARRAA